MRSALGSALCLAGCGFTVSADERVTVTIERASIGAAVTIAPDDVSGQAAAFLAFDESAPLGLRRIPADHIGTSSWGAELSAPLPLELLLPAPNEFPRVLDLGTRRTQAIYTQLEHANERPAPSGSELALTFSLDHPVVLGESFQLYAVGPWEATGLAPALGAQSLASTVAHDSMTSLSGHGHVAIAQGDAVFALRYAGPTLTGVAQASPFDETGADNVAGVMLATPLDRRIGVGVTRDADVARLTVTQPALGAFGASWSLTAAPGAQVAVSNGPVLASGGLLPLATVISAAYGSPFPWPAVLYYQVTASRTAMVGGLPASLGGALFALQTATPDGSISLAAAMPLQVTLDGVPLTTDGAMVPKPERPVVVEFTTDRPGAGTLFALTLFELVPDAANTSLVLHTAAIFVARVPRFEVPADMLEPGKHYVVRATAFGAGYDGAAVASGDLTGRSFPFAAGYFDAGVFGVQ